MLSACLGALVGTQQIVAMANSRTDGSVAAIVATQAVILAVIANSLLKAGLAVSLGSPALRRQIALVLGATAAVGAASLWVMH